MVKTGKSKGKLSSKLEGFTISLIHYLIISMSFILGIFTKDWFTLGVITFNLIFILCLNIYVQDCPLTKMENDKLGTGITNLFMKFFQLIFSVSFIYIFGILWLGTLIGWEKPLFQLGVQPFLLAELFKILIVLISFSQIKKIKKYLE